MFGGRRRRPTHIPFDTGINRGRFVCYVRVEYAIKDAFQNGGTEGRANGGRLKSAICLIGLGVGAPTMEDGLTLHSLHAYAEETNRSLGTSDLLSPFPDALRITNRPCYCTSDQ